MDALPACAAQDRIPQKPAELPLVLLFVGANPGPGFEEIEAVNRNGEVVAKSDRATILFKQAPLIPAPQWEEKSIGVIKADSHGAFVAAWKGVRGAAEYIARLKAEDGNVESQRLNGVNIQFKKLKPGSYTLSVRAVDSEGREGLESAARSVFVDQISFVEAPKNRKVSFDDE